MTTSHAEHGDSGHRHDHHGHDGHGHDTAGLLPVSDYLAGILAAIRPLAPARLGDRLHCHGRVRQQGGRSGIYDIEVSDQTGKAIALFRGRSASVRGHFFDTSNSTPPSGNPT